MRVLRRLRGRYRDNEARRGLLGPILATVRERVRDEFLSARDGGRARTEADDPHHRENRPLVHLHPDRYRADVPVQLEATRRTLAITHIRSSDEVQGAKKVLHGALRLSGFAVRYFVILVDSRLLDVSVSTCVTYELL